MTPVSDRLAAIRARIDAAIARSARPQRSVTLLAVTKGHPAAAVRALARAGQLDIGESRVQEAVRKSGEVLEPVRWHLIGHLQRNKVGKALGLFSVIHSVDRLRLLEALAATGRPCEIYVQVNVGGEDTKSGARPEEAATLLRAAREVPRLQVRGLMTMAPYAEDPEEARPHFRALRELLEDLNRLGDGPPLDGLSMGMSGDFEVAIEEGASLVRIGTALVGGEGSAGRLP